MICLTPKPNLQKLKKKKVSFWPPSSPDPNPLHYAIWGILGNKTKATSHRQSRIAWQTISEVSRRKNTAKAKLKAANQQERIKLWKQHFENLLGNPPKITHEPITRIISKQLDIKLGPFTQEELDSVLRKKIGKLQGWTKFPRKYGRPDNSTTYCSDTATQYTIKIR